MKQRLQYELWVSSVEVGAVCEKGSDYWKSTSREGNQVTKAIASPALKFGCLTPTNLALLLGSMTNQVWRMLTRSG